MSDRIIKIGVTGSAGSGKSMVCQYFKQLGLVVLDCDQIAREVVMPGTPGLQKVVELFGKEILDKDNQLDRSALRKKIIHNSEARKQLEQLLHPMIQVEMMVQMTHARFRDKHAVAVEVPLLFELNMTDCFDVTVTVIAEEKELVRRISRRDNVPKAEAQKILAIQMSQEEKKQKADHTILNTHDPSQLFDLVRKLYHKIEKDTLTN